MFVTCSNGIRAKFCNGNRQQAEGSLLISSTRYKSKHANEGDEIDDGLAKRSLSAHSYKMFVSSLHHSRKLQHRVTPEGSFIVWNMKNTKEDADHVHHFSLTERCVCQTRIQQLIQCGHELHVFGFKLPLWNHRWYSTPTYRRDVHNLFESGFFRPLTTSSREEEDDPYEEEQDFGTFETSDETTAEMVGLVTRRRVALLPT
jgi:hypothetical protein